MSAYLTNATEAPICQTHWLSVSTSASATVASTRPRNEPHSFPQVNSRLRWRSDSRLPPHNRRSATPMGALHRKKGRKKVHYPIKVSPLLRPICCPPVPPLLHRSRTDEQTRSSFLLLASRLLPSSFSIPFFLACTRSHFALFYRWCSPDRGRRGWGNGIHAARAAGAKEEETTSVRVRGKRLVGLLQYI